MKLKIRTTILIVVFAMLAINTINAQIYQFDLNWHQGYEMGDLTQQEINAKGGSYVKGSQGTSLEFKGYENNIGFGIKGTYAAYYRDKKAFETDLKAELGILDENYAIAHALAYRSYGAQVGITYIFNLSELFHVEPYVWAGIKYFTSPFDHAVYSLNSTTMTYRKDPMAYKGFNYTPGLKLQWNMSKYGGINIFVEYDGMFLNSDDEISVMYSADTFEKSTINQSYNPQTLNFGLGFTWAFGKGLKDKETID